MLIKINLFVIKKSGQLRPLIFSIYIDSIATDINGLDCVFVNNMLVGILITLC